jgi:putative CocE/NonD family hydrolase
MAGTRPLNPVSTLVGAALGRAWRLPRRRTKVTLTKDLPVPMRDGTILLANHYAPVTDQARPTVLIRCPYGRGPQFGLLTAQLYAERGYHVLLQSTRGTFGSGGTFAPVVHEAQDGQDTVVWLRTQDWFDGRLATLGGSYLGYTQWALAVDPPPELRAMIIHIGPHDMAAAGYSQGSFELYNLLMWSDLMSHQESVGFVRGLVRMMRSDRRLAPALDRLPLRGATDALGGAGAPWYDEWVTHPDLTDAFWQPYRADAALRRSTVPTLLITGWHDYFLNQTLHQYSVLRKRGVDVGMTVGPWTHLTLDSHVTVTEGLAWLDAYAAGEGPTPRRRPVRAFVTGGDGWRDLPDWPPSRATDRTWFLLPRGDLGSNAPDADADADDASTTFRYDPADPTPSVGGRVMSLRGGEQDNTALEARADVLTFTTPPLVEPVEVLGAPTVDLRVDSDNPHADLFVRLCDVDAKGRSVNVTDRLVRNVDTDTTPGTVRTVRITLDDTAHRFAGGHRIRLQISGGAHPRFARNLGTGEPPGTGTATRPTTHHVQHHAAEPSSMSLPAMPPPSASRTLRT